MSYRCTASDFVAPQRNEPCFVADEPVAFQPTAAVPHLAAGATPRRRAILPVAIVLLAAVFAVGYLGRPYPNAFDAGYDLPPSGTAAPRPALSPDAIFARVSPAVVQLVIQDRHNQTIATGSGFLVSRNGMIVTNYHVIEKAHTAQIVVSEKTMLPVTGVVAWDEGADLAIVQISGQVSALPLELSKDNLPPVGAKVFAIGNPEGLTRTLSDGLVSAHRTDERFTLIQTTAPISHGSSGGPLLAPDGSVVGVTTASLLGGQNLNFAVPAKYVEVLLERCKDVSRVAKLPLPGETEPRTFIKRGKVCLEKGDYDQAISEFSEAIRLDPSNPEALTRRGFAWSLKKDYKLAFACYADAIRLDPTYSFAFTCRGITRMDKKDFDKAIQDFDEAIRLDPKDTRHTYYERGHAWFLKGNSDRAIKDYEAASRLDPKSTPTHFNVDYAAAFYLCAEERMHENNYDGAIKDYTRAFELDPTSRAHFIFNRGFAFFKKREIDKAINDYDEAIRLEPKNATQFLFRGLAIIANRNYDAAIRDFDASIRLDPKNALAFSSRGDAWLVKGDYDQALRDYDQAVRLNPVAAQWVDQNRRIAWSRRSGR
jgi:tetratricopeptide (TPR) repeat protein